MKSLESNQRNPERVQTQMYVALQIAAALSSLCEPFLPSLLRNYPNLKGRNSVALERDFRDI
jgi:methionyl-tRNA synthetase